MDDLYGAIAEEFINEDGTIDEESLHQWFKGGGWRQAGGKYDGKPCARQKGQKTTPKCVSRKKYSSMSKKQRDSAGRRKRKKDPNQTKKSGAAKPTYVKTDPQKGGRKKKKKSKKNEELYMNLEQIVREELENVLNEAEYEPGRAVADIDTGERRMSPKEISDEEVQDLADKFNVEAFVEIASDGDAAIIVKHQDGKVAMYNDTEKMYQDLVSRQEMYKGLAGETYEKTAADYKKNPEYFNEDSIDEKKKKKAKKDACYNKVKSRYKVWPSAYASGALVKCRKVGAANWGNSKKESLEIMIEDELTQVLQEKKKKACKPSKGKRFAKRVNGKCRSYGQKGQAKSGGDRIRPGTKKGDAYCARSAKIKKCKNPPCANALSRKKWKCRGSKSMKE